MIKVLIADDHTIVRQGVRALLDSQADISVIGEASDGLEVVAMSERLRPDIVITDAAMPGMNGIEAARQVKMRMPETRVLILSMHTDESYVLQALRNGADGYVLKNETASVLVQAINDALAGRRYLSPPLSERAIEAYVEKARSLESNALDHLTEREREIFQLAAEGHSNPAIGERLSVSPRTVETHKANLMRKLGVRTHTELVLCAIRAGVLDVDEMQRQRHLLQG